MGDKEVVSKLRSVKTPKELLDFVIEVTSMEGIFVFGEILEDECMKEFQKDPAFHPAIQILELFAFGTYENYMDVRFCMYPFHAKQIRKLQMLTIATLAAEHKVLSYEVLQRELDMDNIRNLEDLIIESIYEGVIKAKLDQQGKQIIVESAIGRDIQDGDIDKMIDILTQWQNCSETLLDTINEQKKFVQQEHGAISSMKEQSKRIIEQNKAALQNISQPQ